MGKQRKHKKKKQRSKPVPKNNEIDLDNIFCRAAKKYKIPKIILKAIAQVESSMDIRAYRFEKEFFDRYLKDHPLWHDKVPEKVSASYGLMQLMFTTAYELGFKNDDKSPKDPEELYNPEYNIQLGAKLIRRHLDKMKEIKNIQPYIGYSPFEIAFAWYNGGRKNNPDVNGKLRNPGYIEKVNIAWWQLLVSGEEEC